MTFDKIESYDICRKLRPGLTLDDYEVIWQDFLDHMRRRSCTQPEIKPTP